MKKRLLALLLAVVMVLSLAVTAFAEDQTAELEQTGTEAAETAADQAKDTGPAEDAGADVTEETVGTDDVDDQVRDEEVTDDNKVQDDETADDDETGEDAGTADEAELLTAANEPSPVLSDGTSVIVTVTDKTGRNLSLSKADGSSFHSGETLEQSENGAYELKVTPGGRDIGVAIYGITIFKDSYTNCDENGLFLFRDLDNDGRVSITLDVLEGFQLSVVNETGASCEILDPTAGDSKVENGAWVYAPSLKSTDVMLTANLDQGYVFDAGPDYVEYSTGGGSRNLLVEDRNNDRKVTLTVVKGVTLHIDAGEDDEDGSNMLSVGEDVRGRLLEDGAALMPGKAIYVEVTSDNQVEAEHAAVVPCRELYQSGYYLDAGCGEVTRVFEVTPDGTGDVTVHVVPSEDEAPTPVHIKYEGEMEGFSKEPTINYAFPLYIFELPLNSGYAIKVNGVLCADAVVAVGTGLTEVVVTCVKLAADAKLAVEGDASALVGSFDGETYLLDGDQLDGGIGLILMKNGWAITGVTGGTCSFIDPMIDPVINAPGGEIYRFYFVQAIESTLTITVEKRAPARWVRLRLINDYPDQVKVDAGTMDGLFIAIPEYTLGDLSVDIYSPEEGGSVDAYVITGEGCKIEETVYESLKSYSLKVNDGVDEVVLRVALKTELDAKAPGDPTADAPGVVDQAGTEKELLDTATDVVNQAVQGKTTAGVTEEDAEKIAEHVAAGDTITTQLVAELMSETPDADAIAQAAGEDATVSKYVNARILVQAGGETIGSITRTNAPIALAVTLSEEELAKGLIFFVVRVHDSRTDILPARCSGNVLTFYTDQFSTFGVAYTSDISYATVSPIPDQKWTGKAVTPGVTVTANGRTLTAGTDYDVRYESNTDAGTAKVIITGKDPYTGTVTLPFKIVKTAASGGTGSGSATAPNTGDGADAALWAGLLALSAAGLGLVLGRKKRTEK